MSGTDERIVRMRFDNAQFKKAASETQTQLEEIDKASSRTGKSGGLLNMAKDMETVKVKAGLMQVAVVTAIANIANRAVNAGINIAKSLTLDPIKQGFDEYELKMKSIQTILSNTKGESLKTVTAALNELNTYADKTIYNFANMTQAIGKLTTAGINLQDATAVVKGFSNMVALAGGDANAAAGAMEQFGQGLQAGVIKAIDWVSLSTRGLGSQNLQKAFFETARAAGALKDVPLTTTFEQWSKDVGGFKASLESGWLTTDTATKALKIMTGDVQSVQKLMDQGFSRKAAEDMIDIANNALDSATKVRTLSAFMGTLKEQIGSGWAQMVEIVFGDFNEATKLFTNLSNITGNVIGGFFTYLGKLLKGWDELGGRMSVLHTFRNLLAPIVAIFKILAGLWKKAFPSETTGAGLAAFSKLIQRLTRPLNILAKVISGQITPWQGFFRIMGVGRRILRSFGDFIGPLVERIADLLNIPLPSGNSGFLGFLKKVADEVGRVLKEIQKLINKGDSLKEALGKVSFDLPSLPSLPSLGGDGIGGGAITGKLTLAAAGVKDLTSNLGLFNETEKESMKGFLFNPSTKLDSSRVTDSAKSMVSSLQDVSGESETLGQKIGPALSGVKDKIGQFISGFSFDDLMASFNLAVLATFVISVSRMLNTMSKSFEGFIGTGEAINGILENTGNALKSFQTQARAKLLLNIGIAIGILAASLWLLSRIPADKLASALAAMAGLALIMKVTMGSFSDTIGKMEGKGINLKMLTIGASMVLFAISISILAGAMKKLNDVDWGSVVKVGAAMYGLTKAMEALSKLDSDGIVKSSFALILVSGGLLVFALAVKQFAKLDLGQFAEGMAYAAVALGTLVLFMRGFESSLGGAAALVVVSGALIVLVEAIKKMAALDLKTFAKGLAFVGASLVVLVVALQGFQTSLAGAAAMVVVVGALWGMVGVIQAFASLDWSTFAKGLGMFAIAMVTLGALMALMGVFAPLILLGAAALLIFGGAMFLLGSGILFLSKGMVALIAIAGGVVGAISAFAVGAAIGFGVFLQTLALQAPIMKDSFLKILQTLIDTLVEAVPMVIDGVKRLWAAIMKELGGGKGGGGAKGAAMQATGKSWIEKLGDGIKKMLPAIVKKAAELAVKFLEGLAKYAGRLAAAGVGLIVGLINGISSKLGDIVNAAVDLVINFARGIEDNAMKLVNAGIQLIGKFLHDLASAIRSSSGIIGSGITDVLDAMKDVGVDMVKGLISGITSMTSAGLGAIGDLASSMIGKAKDMFKIFSPSKVFADIGKFLVQGLTQGIQNNAASAITAVASMVSGQIAVATEYMSKFIQKLDQQAIAANAKAAGLQKAAQLAAQRADEATEKAAKTKKNKKDDKEAKKLQKEAKEAQKRADKAQRQAEKADDKVARARAKRERAEEFADASFIDKAKMRSEDAQNQMDAAKQAELNAAAKRAEAQALREAAKDATGKDAKEMRKKADALETQAKKEAERANKLIKAARDSASEALDYQRLAGEEAARLFQEMFDAEAKADADEEAFNKLSDAEKAAERRRQADALQAKANADLQRAKELAYTDLEAANELAQQALEEADQARAYLQEAAQLELQVAQGSGASAAETGGVVVNLDPTQAAAIAFNDYEALYDAGVAAAAAGQTVMFQQFNTSPEALNPTEVYRQTNNQLAYAAGKLQPAA